MTNNEIVQHYINNRLIKTCVEVQGRRAHISEYTQDDIFQDVVLILPTYDNEKLNKIPRERHMNAFITGILTNQIYSSCSAFHKGYRKFDQVSDEITWREEERYDDTFNPFEKRPEYEKIKEPKDI